MLTVRSLYRSVLSNDAVSMNTIVADTEYRDSNEDCL